MIEVPTSTFLKISLPLTSVMVVFFLHWQLLCWFFFLLSFTGDIFEGLIRFQSLIHTHSVLEVSAIRLSGLFKWFTKLYFQFFFQTSNPYSQLSDEYFQLNVLWFLQIQQFLKSNLFSHYYAGISFQFGKLRVTLEHPIIHFHYSGPSRYPNRLLSLPLFFFHTPQSKSVLFGVAILLPCSKILKRCPLSKDRSLSSPLSSFIELICSSCYMLNMQNLIYFS